MKRIKCVLLAAVLLLFLNAGAEDGNFNLAVSSDGKVILQRVQLINGDGYDKTIAKEARQYDFNNTVERYGIYTLSVSWLNAASKKTGSATVHLFLKAGDTKLVFRGSAGKYDMVGTSAGVQKKFEAMVSKDQVYLKRVQLFEYRLRRYRESGNKKAVAQMKDSISKTELARKAHFESYIRQHPKDDLSLYAMRMYSGINLENPLEVQSVLSTLGTELRHTVEMMEIKKDAVENEQFMKGVKAPGFTQADTSGKAITLASLQGRYVLIDFWASWCKPCRAQNPSLLRLYQKYQSKGFTILGVSLDSNKEAWLKAIHDDKLKWQQVSDLKSWKNEVARQYKISSVPQNYLLDAQGVIIGKNLDEDELDEVLEKELTRSK